MIPGDAQFLCYSSPNMELSATEIADLNCGLGKLDRERLSALLRGTEGTITNDDAAKLTGLDRAASSKVLARLCEKGWLSRVSRGLYVPVALVAEQRDCVLENVWAIAGRLYSPCYIAGYSAAEHWDFTDRIFLTTVVMTEAQPKDRNPTIRGSPFLVNTISPEKVFGLDHGWYGRVRVSVSDPSRTILDMLCSPELGGGIRSVQDMFREYLASAKWKDLDQLLGYAERFGNGTVFKRLGFLLETNAPQEVDAIERCRQNLTKSKARIAPGVPSEILVERWRLWVPLDWRDGVR